MKKVILVVLLALAVGVSAQDAEKKKTKKDAKDAKVTTTDKAKKEIKTVTTPSGLKYEELVAGAGPQPKTGDIVKVHYTGWLTNGKKFDSSVDRGQPFEFHVGRGEVIKGWDEGVGSMKVGSKRKLTIPPDLGYGSQNVGNGLIPPNSTLVFEVELLGIK